MDELSRTELLSRMKEKTGLENPNSVTQLKAHLAEKGLEAESLGKKDVAALLKDAPPELSEVLKLRQQISKSSVKKYQAMQDAVCEDGRCRGMFQFYGANRSGRWAGRLIQLQNLPQNKMPDLQEARGLVREGDYETLKLLYDSVPDVLSQLIRTAFIPAEGMKFVVADYSAVEARVLSYLAGEDWRIRVFHEGRDIYCESASRMFGVPVEKHGRNSHLRQKGKIAELALGYGGSVGALKSMGALEMGLKEEELQPLVSLWRESNPKITQYWWDVDAAVREAVIQQTETRVGEITFHVKSKLLFIALPSGRRLAYVKPRIEPNQYGGESVTYMGIDGTKHWSKIESFGPKFVENIVQAVSRDLLANAMKNLGYNRIVAHVHDELIIECNPDANLDAICRKMSEAPSWLPGLELRADGYECGFYQKQ